MFVSDSKLYDKKLKCAGKCAAVRPASVLIGSMMAILLTSVRLSLQMSEYSSETPASRELISCCHGE